MAVLWLEIMGYFASVLVAISLAMKNIKRLRIINLIGAIVFVIYGAFISAYPIVLVNGIIAAINVHYLRKIVNQPDAFDLIYVSKNDPWIKIFLDFYREELQEFFPNFTLEKISDSAHFVFIFRNLLPVGLFVYEIKGDVAEIYVDYVAPEYRDFKNAHFLFSQTDRLLEGYNPKRWKTFGYIEEHIKYLKKMGFVQDENNPLIYTKIIKK